MTIVNANRFVRKMRGGAQAHMLEGEDGYFYIVKFRNNPQHRRILVNELVAAILLRHLQIMTPEIAIVNINPPFLADNPQVGIQSAAGTMKPQPGWHFGSRYPGTPDSNAVYDFMPDSLIPKVANLADFRAALVFDKWTSNIDARQCIFFRANLRETRSPVTRQGFVASMIDNGHVFNGWHWNFPESAVLGLYWRQQVYEQAHSLEAFEPWLTQVVHMPTDILDFALKRVPGQWVDGAEDALEQLVDRLYRRRKRVPDLIAATLAETGLRRSTVPVPELTSVS